MTLNFSVEIPDALYEKISAAALKEGVTIERIIDAELFHLFNNYWTEKATNLTREDYLKILQLAPNTESNDYDKL